MIVGGLSRSATGIGNVFRRYAQSGSLSGYAFLMAVGVAARHLFHRLCISNSVYRAKTILTMLLALILIPLLAAIAHPLAARRARLTAIIAHLPTILVATAALSCPACANGFSLQVLADPKFTSHSASPASVP